MARLVGVEGTLKGKAFDLGPKVVLGRAFEADVRLDDLIVSRRHAVISERDGRYAIEDLGSGNGTYVNDDRVESPRALHNGDLIRLADNLLRFEGPMAPGETGGVQLADGAGRESPVVQTLDIGATLMNLKAPPGPEALLKANERFRTVLEISNAVQTQLDMKSLLDGIMERLFAVFPQADRGFVMMRSETEEGKLVSAAARGRGKEKLEEVTISRSIVDRSMCDRVAVLSADAMSDTRFSAAMSVVNFQIRSMMCAPIIANDEPLGIIHLDTTHQDRQFTMDDLDLLTGVANQVAFAIANARMHERLLRQQRMERDLQLARQVQESFLPRSLPEAEGLEFAATYKAALEVGGDFYDLIPLADGRIGVVVGDVAGKGMPAALLMARMSSDVRFFALNEPNPGAVLRRVNDRLCEMNPEGSFVTVIYGTLDPVTRLFRMANAAHPPPVLRKASGEAVEVTSCTNFPIGAVEGAEFEEESFTIGRGEFLAIFSDGVTEAMNEKKELFGTERLLRAAVRPAADVKEYMGNILSQVQAHVQDAYQSDDLTLVCFGAE
jgi:serine phosphatase RsbU (regulator of sigma subunit)